MIDDEWLTEGVGRSNRTRIVGSSLASGFCSGQALQGGNRGGRRRTLRWDMLAATDDALAK